MFYFRKKIKFLKREGLELKVEKLKSILAKFGFSGQLAQCSLFWLYGSSGRRNEAIQAPLNSLREDL